MKLFDILKQQGLFSNDIKTRIKNNQISINNEVVKNDSDINIKTLSDDVKIVIEKISKFNDNFKIEFDHNNTVIFSVLLQSVFNNDSLLIEEVFNKLNVKIPELITLTIFEMKEILNDFLSQKIDIAVIKESGEFICELGKLNPIFITQLKMFGFENLFDSNIKNDLTDILNQFILVKISKKESFLLKKNCEK